MASKFSLYDFIAVVVPGVFLLWALGTFANIAPLRSALPLTGGIAEASVLVVVGYIVGLMLQGLSQRVTEKALLWWWGGFPSARWLLPGDGYFTPAFKKELSAGIRARFGGHLDIEREPGAPRDETMKRNQEIFYRCYRSVEKLSDLPQTFNAQYGLFRALMTTFGLLVMALVGRVLIEYYIGTGLNVQAVIVGGLCMAGVVVSYWRVTKRGEDFARAVYDVFLANYRSAGTAPHGEAKA